MHVHKNILDNINLADDANEFVGTNDSHKQTFRHFSQNLSEYVRLKSLVTIRMNEIFPGFACCGQKLNFYVRKSRQR